MRGIVTFQLKEHYPTEESARQVVEPYLRAWEISRALKAGNPELAFQFEAAEVIDRGAAEDSDSGSTVVVRMPNGSTSNRSDSIQPSTPNFAAA